MTMSFQQALHYHTDPLPAPDARELYVIIMLRLIPHPQQYPVISKPADGNGSPFCLKLANSAVLKQGQQNMAIIVTAVFLRLHISLSDFAP